MTSPIKSVLIIVNSSPKLMIDTDCRTYRAKRKHEQIGATWLPKLGRCSLDIVAYVNLDVMKLLSLNTWGGQLGKEFDDFIKEQSKNIDIFCFQEVFHKAYNVRPQLGVVRPDLFEELEILLPEHVGHYAPSQDDDEGLAIFISKKIKVDKTGDIFVYRWFNAMSIRIKEKLTQYPTSMVYGMEALKLILPSVSVKLKRLRTF